MYRGMGAVVMGPDGTPVTVDTSSPDSVTLDYTAGFSVAPGAPGSVVNGQLIPAGYGWGTPIAPTPSPVSSSINPLYLIGGGLGVILLISLLGGRRR